MPPIRHSARQRHAKEIVRKLAEAPGVPAKSVRIIVEGALKELNKVAFLGDRGATDALMECCWSFGSRASFHLGGILEAYRTECSPGIPIDEFLRRFLGSDYRRNLRTIEKWRKGTQLS